MKKLSVSKYIESFKSILKDKFFSLKPQMDEISTQLTTQVNPAVVIDSHTPPVSSFCSGCGKPLVPDSKFCGGCGTQLATA
jgi:NADH pyrophosphatase NudC (nudix superfamily)